MNCKFQLRLKNDNKNSYDYVMAVLIKVCYHELIQAEQCAIITHNNGIVNERFLCNCGIDQRLNTPLWDENIWKDEGSFRNDYKLNSQLTTSIDKVLIPYIHNAVKFIDEYISGACNIIKTSLGT